MSKMIGILVDDRKFVISRRTLDLNPDFPITELLSGTKTIGVFPYIEFVNDNTFIIDTDPTIFEKVVQSLRQMSKIF